MKGSIWFTIIITLMVSAAAAFVPGEAYRYAVWKAKKREKPLPLPPESIWQKLGCILFCGAFTAVTAVCEPSWKALFAAGFALVACFGICVDEMIRMIGNEMVLGLFGAGILYRLLSGGWRALLSSLEATGLILLLFIAAAFLTKLIASAGGVGMGDIKLAMVGAFIAGTENLIPYVVGMSAAMIGYILCKFKLRTLTRRSAFPMCLPLMAGLLFSVSQEFFRVAQNTWNTLLWG